MAAMMMGAGPMAASGVAHIAPTMADSEAATTAPKMMTNSTQPNPASV